jgi:Tfp pilus assembly protein PilX
MYNPTRSHRGSALLVGLIIVVLLTILTTSFLEKVLGLGRTSGAIGNSAQAYTLATGLIEEQLMSGAMTRAAPWNIPTRSE